KNPAYSKIGSNESWDRFSVLSPMVLDKGQSQESADGKTNVYQGVVGVDQDIVYEKSGETIFLPGPTYDDTGNPSYKSFMIGAVMENSKIGTTISMVRPDAVFFYNGNQYKIPVRYVYYEGQLLDFNSGLDAILRMIPEASQDQQGGLKIDNSGAMIYLSPKIKDTLFAQLYLMDDPFENYPTIELAHKQEDIIVESIRGQGANIESIMYYQGFRGPIKIWDTRNIPENILIKEEFWNRDRYDSIGEGEIPWAPFDDFEFVR
ncbi:MAG: hypothetical protein Q8P81_04105, partial [Nanoarchaeota archaeon]|nr:hypothetical protein [Nanoarchaeota archaeon]